LLKSVSVGCRVRGTNASLVMELRLALVASARICALAVVGCAASITVAVAGEYPDRPIRIVTPFPAGSATDIVARPIAAKLSEKWSQPVVVDNRSGAGGTISAEIVAKSPPDGHTLLIGATGPNTVNPALIKSMPYDSVRAFAPVTILATNNLLLTVPLSLPVTSVKELIELAHSKPGHLRYGSSGIGAMPHLAGELFKAMARVDIVHVPYKGSPQYVVDLLSGRIDMVIGAAGPVLPHVKVGRLRLLAVSAAARDPALPNVPTMGEEGVPGYEVIGWYGLLAPAGTPAAVIKKLHAEVARILAQPDLKAIYVSGGLEAIASSSPAEFGALIQTDRDKWAKVIKAANIRIE
jgi:tripartite-type tricarboxylate transporter receptor subunit TctC